MIVGYDAKRAFLNNTGLGNYSRWLIKSMVQFHPENQYRLYTPRIRDNRHKNELSKLKNICAVTPGRMFLPSWWRSQGVVKNLRTDKVDLYHGLSHELPFSIKESGIKTVLTVHDLIFMRFPQYFKWIDRLIYKAKLAYACRTADRIVAISQKTKDDLVELLNIPASKIEVIYQGCDNTFTLYNSEAYRTKIRKKYNLPKRYILSVGTIEERKNLLLLVKALARSKDSIRLIVVGKATDYIEEVKQFINASNTAYRVTFLHDVTFDELPVLYQLATLFVYPSRYEGFGIPVIEALCSGVPVIAATGSCLEEAGGPDSLYINPDDDEDLARKISRVWNSPALRQQMITKGFEYAKNFNHEKLADQLMQLYQKTLNHA
ncbi:glycosyltransferase family 4 protein [Mucilaginibacter terrae]|uniref:Glycosyltransferase involved in cell wall biosynthesis n=1 Tax=Mucilaginibacter terrae TaxID=1955052 RepID=A0ABU3GS53_9SPHI|nr:glycosyltransferase family 1 protein [Mucilaginibacter terrae]MDT3402475.1 glycosyltransferase involved in cell wall biosynthesis [Mucilaginibacter terrae]